MKIINKHNELNVNVVRDPKDKIILIDLGVDKMVILTSKQASKLSDAILNEIKLLNKKEKKK